MAKGEFKKLDGLSPEEREYWQEVYRRGSQKSGESRRRKKQLREELEELLALGDVQERISLALIHKAMQGDVKAYETIRSTLGEDSPQVIEQRTSIINVTVEDGDKP